MRAAQPTLQGVPAPDAAAATDVAARRERQHAHYRQVLAHYTPVQQAAVRRLYETAAMMLDTGGGSRCAKLLLGLYNGSRFPFDLTDLRSLDTELFEAAMVVLRMDARHTWCEVHVLLDAIYADGRSTGCEFEHWAHSLRLKGRCKREYLSADYGPKWERVQ